MVEKCFKYLATLIGKVRYITLHLATVEAEIEYIGNVWQL